MDNYWLKASATVIITALCFAGMLTWNTTHAVDAQFAPPVPVQTTSIGVIAPVFRVVVPPPQLAAAYPEPTYEWVRVLAQNRGECAVRIQLTDFVTDQKTRCFSYSAWHDPAFGVGWIVFPVPSAEEYSIEYAPGQWMRMSNVRGPRRRAVRR